MVSLERTSGDAAANFQKEVRKFMHMHGFTVGCYSSRTYFHTGMRIRVIVHGDDFISADGRGLLD